MRYVTRYPFLYHLKTASFYVIRIEVQLFYSQGGFMSNQEYDELWHYSEQFTRDNLQRSELVTMAWKEGERLGDGCTPGLMKSMMHFRSKELNRRSAFPAKEMGKRTLDAWNRPERVYLDRPIPNSCGIVADFLLSEKATPYDHTVVNDFIGALTTDEQSVLDDLNAGFKRKEICQRQSITNIRLNSLHNSIQNKAVAYL